MITLFDNRPELREEFADWIEEQLAAEAAELARTRAARPRPIAVLIGMALALGADFGPGGLMDSPPIDTRPPWRPKPERPWEQNRRGRRR